jgi:disulfide oxidoreductase YuzD
MYKKLFLTVGFVFMITFVLSANAEEFTFKSIDSVDQTIYYQLTNATMIKKIVAPPDMIKFEVNGTNGLLVVSLPKTLPILATETQPNLVMLNREEIVNLSDDDTNCHFNFTVPIDGITELEFVFSYWPERPLPIYYLDIDDNCNLSLDESIIKIQNKLCSDEKMMKVMNIRDEVVCISAKTSVFDKLLDRGYLKPTDVIITKKYTN